MEERVDIVVNDRIAPTIAPKLRLIAIHARSAATGVSQLRGSLATVRGPAAAASAGIRETGRAATQAKGSFISLGVVLRTMFQIYFAYAAVKRIIDMADAYKTLQNRIALVTDTTEQGAKVLDELFEVAKRSRAPIESTVTAFQRFDLAMAEMGRSQEDTIRLTETVNKMLLLTGSTSEEARSGMLQLSQAFNKGKLDGDEFRTVMETMPLVAKAMTERFGITKKELYDMARAGEITAATLADALAESAKDVDKAFDDLDTTLTQAVENMQTEAVRVFGKMNEQLGGSNGLVGLIETLTEKLDDLATMLGGVYVILMDIVEPVKDISSALNLGGMAAGVADLIALLATASEMANNSQSKTNVFDTLISMFMYGGFDFNKMHEWRRAGLNKPPKDVDLRGNVDKTVPFDMGPYDEYLKKLEKEIDYNIARAAGELDYVRQLEFERDTKMSVLDLSNNQYEELLRTMEASERHNEVMKASVRLYRDTVGGLKSLENEHEALRRAHEAGWISVEAYRIAWADLRSEFIYTKAAMTDINDVSSAFGAVLDSLELSLMDVTASMGLVVQRLSEVWTNSFEEMTRSVGDLVAQWAVFRESMSFIDMFRRVIAEMISQLVALTTQYIIVGIARQFAGVSLPTGGGGTSSSTNPVSMITPTQSDAGPQMFASGGYTGNLTGVAGLVHGREFVMNAAATARHRETLEAMNAGKSAMPNIVINNNSSATIRTESVSADEVRLICEDTVSRRAPDVIARDIENPNGRTSKSLRQHTTAGRRYG